VTELLDLTPDELLTTTRAVRKRLDLERPVGRDVIEECIEIALQAPSGSNRQAWQWVPVDDPDTKVRIAELYREVFDAYEPRSSGYVEGDTRAERRAAVTASSIHLRNHLHEVPVLLVVYQEGRIEALPLGSHPGFWGSVVPAVWSFMLALRARGLGSTWTTMTCRREKEMAEVLGVRHEDYTQVGLFPVAYTLGTDFKPAPRLDPSSVIHWNRW
jgi:nitroreductase